jgi:hypothetical protein
VAWRPKSLRGSFDAYDELKCCGLALVEELQGQQMLVALTKEMGWELTIVTLDLDSMFVGVKAQKVRTFINSFIFFVLFSSWSQIWKVKMENQLEFQKKMTKQNFQHPWRLNIFENIRVKVHWAKLLVANLVTFSNGDDANAIVMLRKKDYVSWVNNGVGYL